MEIMKLEKEQSLNTQSDSIGPGQTVCLTYFHFHEQKLAAFTLETDYPSDTGCPLDNSRQTDNTT